MDMASYVTQKEYLEKLINESELLVVLFYGPSHFCNCTLRRLGDLAVVFASVENESIKEVADYYGVEWYPQALVFRKGQLAKRLFAPIMRKEIETAFNSRI